MIAHGISRRRPLRPSIPLADAADFRQLARRTAILRAALALALVALLAAEFVLARRLQERQSGFFPAGASGVVALDLSTSVDPSVYRRIESTLKHIVATDQPVGLIVFSDTAYEALPPGTKSAELRPLLRFFSIPGQQPFSSPQPTSSAWLLAVLKNPWAESFRGGTRISKGLRLAREVLERDGIERGSVLLISDLDDSPFDIPYLSETLVGYARDSITLRVVPLSPSFEDRDLFKRVLGEAAFVTPGRLTRPGDVETASSLVGGSPLSLLVVGAVLALLLAVNEHLCGRLAWREERGQ